MMIPLKEKNKFNIHIFHQFIKNIHIKVSAKLFNFYHIFH